MSSLRKLERDYLTADRAAVQRLLARMSDEDVMARFGLEDRLAEIEETIAELEQKPLETNASAALFFGGKPVVGTLGIESEFAGNAVSKFQDIVSKVMANEAGTLGQRGIVPNKAASILHVTNVVRGSFGFMLEEIEDQTQIVSTSLKTAVDETTRLLDAFGEPGEDRFRAAVESIDQRVLTTAQEFFNLMRQNGATLRLVSGDVDRTFTSDAVVRAAERATSTRVEDSQDVIAGQLAGVLPDERRFEFRTLTARGVIHGKIDRSISDEDLNRFNKDLLNIDSKARISVRRIFKSGDLMREAFVLLAIN